LPKVISSKNRQEKRKGVTITNGLPKVIPCIQTSRNRQANQGKKVNMSAQSSLDWKQDWSWLTRGLPKASRIHEQPGKPRNKSKIRAFSLPVWRKVWIWFTSGLPNII